jgi:hypothetical protein
VCARGAAHVYASEMEPDGGGWRTATLQDGVTVLVIPVRICLELLCWQQHAIHWHSLVVLLHTVCWKLLLPLLLQELQHESLVLHWTCTA